MSDIMTDIAVAADDFSEDTLHGKFLAFSLGEQRYAIAIEFVVDIINVQPITRVPNCPDYVKGITNLRGKAIPIIDLRLRFGKEPHSYTDRTCIIVLEERGASVGVIVDNVEEVLNLEDEQISPPPTFQQGMDSNFILGVGRSEVGITLILDCNTVLDDNLADEVSAEEEF